MSGSGFDLTTLVGYTYAGLDVAFVNLDASTTSASSGVYTVANEIQNEGETRSGVANNTFTVNAATNGAPSDAGDDPNAVGTLTVTETQNGAAQPPFVLNVLGYSSNAVLTGLASTYQAGNDTAPYSNLFEFSDVNIGLHASDNPSPPTFPQTFMSDPTALGYTSPVPPCFASGTPILTASGERAVETLLAGDVVLTASGEALPVRWVGHRRVRLQGGGTVALDDRPVRVSPHAFGPGQPHCAVTLSPDHAVFMDGALVPIHLLVDDVLISRSSQPEITYHHVELDRHDVLLAAGLPAESYLDTGNRRAFAEGQDGVVSLYPDFLALSWEAACAPLVLHGNTLDTLRARLTARRGDFTAQRRHHGH